MCSNSTKILISKLSEHLRRHKQRHTSETKKGIEQSHLNALSATLNSRGYPRSRTLRLRT